MKKDRVIYKDFGKIMTDTENRDEGLKAYICAILDVPQIQFDDIIKDIKTEKSKEAFIHMLSNDLKVRTNKFFNEGDFI